jgi:hypothetical protein
MFLVLFLMLLPVLMFVIAAVIAIGKVIHNTIATKRAERAMRSISHSEALEQYNALIEEENKKEREIDYYNALIANLEDLQRIVEKKSHDEKQLRQLITLDKQIHAAQVKLEKLG